MRMLHIAGVSVLAYLLVSTPAPGQERVIISGPPEGPGPGMPGMNRQPAKTGTARIRGRVVSAESGAGLRRAQVRMSGPEVGSRLAITDADGRFTFEGLPAGRVSLTASKPGFVSI